MLESSVSSSSIFHDAGFTRFLTSIAYPNQTERKLERPVPAICFSSTLSTISMQRSLVFGQRNSLLKWLDARCLSNASFELKIENDVIRFNLGNQLDNNASPKSRKKMPKRVKMSKKTKLNELRMYRLKAKKKMNSPNPEVRIRYKLEKVTFPLW